MWGCGDVPFEQGVVAEHVGLEGGEGLLEEEETLTGLLEGADVGFGDWIDGHGG